MDQVKFGGELISRLMTHLCDRLRGCRGVGLSVWPDGAVVRAVGVAQELDPAQVDGQRGPLVDASRGERQVTGKVGGLDVVAVPGSWGDGGPVVLTVYLDHPPGVEDLSAIEEIEPLVATAAAVVEFCAGEVLRAEQMVRMVQHRRHIEQAKGLLMGAGSCTPGEAFELLVRASQHANVKLRDVATSLVLVASGELEDADAMTPPPRVAYETAQRLWESLHV